MSKYWKTTITAVVLTRGDEAPVLDDLADVHYQITEGDASGEWKRADEEITKGEMRTLLEAQGSDAEFLLMDEEDGEEDNA